MLTPTLLQQAGLPLSDYYEYLLEMKHNTPVVTAANDYMKVDGSTAEYGADPALDEWAKGVSDAGIQQHRRARQAQPEHF